MANYTFETMTADDADNFTAADRLIFLSGTPGTVTVTHQDATTGGLHPTGESITITSGAVSHTFLASALAGASADHNLIFISSANDTLAVDDNTGSTLDLSNAGGGYDPATFDVDADAHTVLYAFGGADTITGGNASDWIDGGNGADSITGYNDGSDDALAHKTDVLQGGLGDDVIVGSDGNDHIYGNSLANVGTDGNDSISAMGGNDYVQGNAGNDTIDGGDDNDKLYGGNGVDSVMGGNGHDYIQGNKGDDHLFGNDGNDTIRGGADNDVIDGGNGHDWLSGDNGDDTLTGGAGYDTFTGGAGNDVFTIHAGDADITDVTLSTGHGNTDQIVDFTATDDQIQLDFTPAHVLLDTSGTTYNTALGAEQAADTILSHGAVGDVVAIQVGSDTYLFFHGDGTTTALDSAVKLDGIHAADVSTDWFA